MKEDGGFRASSRRMFLSADDTYLDSNRVMSESSLVADSLKPSSSSPLASRQVNGKEQDVADEQGENNTPPTTRLDGGGLAPPKNVTGVYSGKWEKLNDTTTEFSKDLHMHASSGSIGLKFDTWRSNVVTENSHLVVGALGVQDGNDPTSRDFNVDIRGFYFPDEGRLIAYAGTQGGELNAGDSSSSTQETTDEDLRKMSHSQGASLLSRLFEHYSSSKKDENTERGTEVASKESSTSTSSSSSSSVMKTLSSRSSCPIQIELVFDVVSADVSPTMLQMSGSIHSPACNIHLHVTGWEIDMDSILDKVRHYVAIITMLSLAQLVLLYNQMVDSTAPARATKVSMLTIGIMSFIDAYLCSLHMVEGMIVEPLMQQFIISSLFQLVSFALIGMRLLLLIWKARRPDSFNNGWEQMRREFSVLYTRFYLCIFVGIILMFQLQRYLHIIIFALYSFWIPQIVHNAMADCNKSLQPRFVLGTSLCRLFLPLYIFGCPVNFFAKYQFNFTPNMDVAVALVVWVGIQIAVLLLQDHLGPRFFVPARFLPPKFDYHELSGIDRDLELGEENPCPICYSEFDPECPPTDIMRTPCNHLFHTECLSRWMEQKMECPACRQALPSL